MQSVSGLFLRLGHSSQGLILILCHFLHVIMLLLARPFDWSYKYFGKPVVNVAPMPSLTSLTLNY